MSHPALRRLWLRLHRWTALGLGWLLALTALCGTLLVFVEPLDHSAHPELFRSEAAPADAARAPVALETVRRQLVADFGKTSNFTFRPTREPGESLRVLVRGKSFDGTVYLDPATGREQGRRGEYEGFYNTLYKLHSAILLGDTGKAILAWVSLVYVFLLVTGLVLWWPKRWPPALAVTLNKGLLRGLFDLHRTGGAVLGLLVLVSVLSGAYMAWRPLAGVVNAIVGHEPAAVPQLPKSTGADLPALPLDELVASAQRVFPGQQVGYILVTPRTDRPMRLRFKLDDDPHPNGLTSVWVHPGTGEILGVTRWNKLDLGARIVSVVYPLHAGKLGGSWLSQLYTAAMGLTLGGLGISGLWLWWKRRTATARARHQSGAISKITKTPSTS